MISSPSYTDLLSDVLGEAPSEIRVLHVDDDPDFAELAATFLERTDEALVVETATSAREGLDRLAEGRFDCVVSDYDMSEMDGLAFLEAVRDQQSDFPFILFTGRGSEEVASRAISAGVTDYLQKSAGTDQYTLLANKVTNAVERYRAERSEELGFKAMQTAREGIGLMDSEGHFIYVNPSYAETFGYDPSEMVGDHWSIIYPEDQVDYIRNELLPSISERGTWTGESVHERKDGSEITTVHTLSYTDEDILICTVRDITEEVEQRETFAEQRRALNLLVDNAEEYAIFLLDTDGYVTSWNAGAARIKGYEADEIIGEHFSTFHTAQAREAGVPESMLADARANGQAHDEGWRVRKDGSEFWADVTLVALYDDGTLQGFGKVTRDMTDRRTQEQELERRNALFSTLVDELPAGVLVEDSSRSIVATNDRLVEMFDLSESTGELVGKDCVALLREVSDILEAPERAAQRIQEILDARQPVRNERVELVDGRIFERTYVPLSLPEDEGNLWMYRDVTERTRRETALADERGRMEFALDATDSVLWEHGIDANEVTYVGPSKRLLGVEPDVIDSFEDFLQQGVHPDDRERIVREMKRIQNDETTALDIEFRTDPEHDGVRWVRAHGFVRETDSGRDLVGLSTDITARKQREQELERQNERLDEFTSIVSHDLQSPLAVLNGYLELAAETGDPEHFDRCWDAIDRMEALIDDLLDLAREGETISSLESVELPSLVEECWQTVETGETSLQVETDRTLRADPSRLRQLLENLVRNSAEHGGSDVTVTVDDLDDGFYVADDGPGIPEAQRESVFAVGETTKEDGSGLGLAIVREIAEAHGWDVHLTESDDGGARFEFTNVETA